MNTKEVLIAARALIVKGWCRGTAAKNARNAAVPVDDPTASKFCAIGAVRCVAGFIGANGAIMALCDFVPAGVGLTTFNDSKRNKRDVLRIFDKAIALQP